MNKKAALRPPKTKINQNLDDLILSSSSIKKTTYSDKPIPMTISMGNTSISTISAIIMYSNYIMKKNKLKLKYKDKCIKLKKTINENKALYDEIK